jgi:hypothetical protein
MLLRCVVCQEASSRCYCPYDITITATVTSSTVCDDPVELAAVYFKFGIRYHDDLLLDLEVEQSRPHHAGPPDPAILRFLPSRYPRSPPRDLPLGMEPDILCEVMPRPVIIVMRSVIPSRMVTSTSPGPGVELSLFSEYGYPVLEVLARTSTPARRLAILIVDLSASKT